MSPVEICMLRQKLQRLQVVHEQYEQKQAKLGIWHPRARLPPGAVVYGNQHKRSTLTTIERT